MLHLSWRVTGMVMLGVLLFLVISLTLQTDFPQPTGRFSVGRTSQVWLDASRPEVVTQDLSDFRSVPVTLWYPAEAAGAKSPYFPDLERLREALIGSGEVTRLEVLGLRLIKSHAVQNAPVADSPNPFPVILLSPGNGTNAEFYTGIATDLASHGYIVVAINHPYDVAAVALQGGRVAQFSPGPFEMQAREAWVAERVAVRTGDVLYALRELERLAAEGLFAGRIDLKRVAVMGHSLGGITAVQACLASAQVLA